MDTREIAKEYRLTHWAGIMQERIGRGISIKGYCRESGIRENVYYYWQRKLRETACHEILPSLKSGKSEEIVPGGWTTCEPARDTAEVNGTVIIEIGKSRIRATEETNPEVLAKVCRALMSIC